MADYKVPILTGSALSEGDLLRWDGTNWVNYSDNKFHKIHTGKVGHFAGNNGMGQSFPSYVNYTQEATIAGTRTSDVIFTRTAGTWVVDALIGQYVYSYAIADTDAGSWLPITDNDETTLTVDGVLYAGCDNVKTCVWNPMQNIYAHGGGNTLFAGGVFDGESVWLVPYGSGNLVKVNPSDGSMTTYAHGQGGAAFRGGVFDGESVWLVPYSSDNLVKVNPSDGSMTTYAHGEAEGTAAFWGGVFDGESVWLVPYNSDNLVKVNPSDGSMTTYAHGQGGAAFAGGVFDGESIWLVPDRSDNLVKVNPADGSMTTYAHGQGDYAFIGGVFDGESIWLAPYRSNNLVKVNPSDGSMTTYAHGQGDLASQGGVFDGESVWLVPYDSDNLVKVNPADGSMTTYAHGQGGAAFAGGVFDGESIWLIPYTGDNLVSFIPPRFGRPSLHTTGPVNAASAKIGDASNNLKIGGTGVVTLAGTAKRSLTLRADLDYTTVTAQGKPAQASVGVFNGYSMPIYAADNEELFFNENVPGRWDAASDISFHVLVALASAEDVGDKFKFQFSWNQVGETDVVPATTNDVTDEITVVDGTQYATYYLEFTIDYNVDAGDPIAIHDDLAGRLRRVASTGPEIAGALIVLDWHTHYTVDKMFKAPE